MAVSIGYKGKSLEELERDITCTVCQEHYTEPKVLPCLHYYCKKCILRLALTNQPFPCPECCKETILPEGGVDELRTAFFVHRMEAMYSTVERIHGKVEVKCEGCTSGSNAISFCRQCTAFICKACVEPHQRMKMFKGHNVVSMLDLKVGKVKATINIKVTDYPVKCKVHKKHLKLYCFDCDRLICRDCTVKDHRDHNFEFSTVSAPQTKEKIMRMLEPLRKVAESLSLAVEEVQITKQEVEAQGISVASTIQSSFDELFEMMKKHKQEMLDKAEELVQVKMDKLSVQEKELSLAGSEVNSVVDYTERFMRHSSDNEVMSMHADIRSQIKREIEGHDKADRIMEPVEEADMGVEVRCAEVLQQLCQNKITQLVLDPAQCTVRGEGVKTTEVHQMAEVTLTTKLTNNKISRCSAEVLGQLKSLYNTSVVKCDVGQSGPGKYRIQYTPTVRGRHELTVSVNGQQIAGSPFPVFVSIPPTQLGRPVQVWDGLKVVCGIAFNSLGQVIVLKGHDPILALYNKQTMFKSVNRDYLQLRNREIGCLAVDDEDNIYVTAIGACSFLKVSKDGRIIKKVEVLNTSSYLGVTLLGEEVMLCDSGRNGTIVVYDRDLNYLRKITEESMVNVRDISADSHGNLYITDRRNRCIHVLDHHGDLLRSFGCDNNSVNVLTRPLGLHVAGQFVYVCNNGQVNDNHNVSVFTIEGGYVTTFGHKGSSAGQFNVPIAVCVDSDGFVYVCDKYNNRIQIF